jgi:broad specificity phosphatase PhoE
LAEIKFDIVITSALKRSYQTAQILVGDSVPIIQNKLCNERKFGVMEGLTWDEIQTLQPPVLLISVGNDLHTVNPKGGEPFEGVWERAKKFRRFLFREYKGSNILVVSHGVFLQMFHGLLRGLNCIESLASFPSNLELARFRFSGERLVEEKIIKLAGAEALHW